LSCGWFGLPDRYILFQAIEKVSQKGESLGTMRSKDADPEWKFADRNMAETMEELERCAGVLEG
jgi:hypothetical protein